MRRLIAVLLLLLVAPLTGLAQVLPMPMAPPGLLCRQAIRAAEQAHGIPAGLLAAMGRVESGRPDPRTGALLPWPWTIDVEGQGAFFDSQAEAIAAVQASQARGVRSIDIGCMQVNLLHHPDAFASLAQAFDPGSNADYAARFLRDLFAQAGSWPQAAALYHSATPELGDAYREQVMAAWPAESPDAGLLPSRPMTAAWGGALPRTGYLPIHRGTLLRIPSGWSLAPHVAPLAATPLQAACPFAALVGCNRIYRKAAR